VCFAALLLFAESPVPVHPAHDCSGADCLVCLLTQSLENFPRLKYAPVYSGFKADAFLSALPVLKEARFLFIPLSGVRLKVKINR
jgi:hypothetical protein